MNDIQKHRTRHTRLQLLARPDSHEVLTPDGTFDVDRHRKKPWQSVVLPGDTKPTQIPPVTAASAPKAGAADIILTPPNPTDYGTATDGSAHTFVPSQTSVDDGLQGQLSDCYAIAAVNSIAIDHGDFIRYAFTRVGSLYESRFIRNGQVTRVRVDGTVDTYYTPFGPTGALYPITFLKAYAQYRTGENTVASLNIGWSGNVFSDLGLTAVAMSPVDPNAVTSLMAWLSADQPVCVMCKNAGSGKYMPNDHEISVVGVQPIAGNPKDATLILRNQWGFDGGSVGDSNPKDGIITVLLSALAPDIQLFTTAMGFPALPTPITGPTVPVSGPTTVLPVDVAKAWKMGPGAWNNSPTMLWLSAGTKAPISLPAGTYDLALTCDGGGKAGAGAFGVGAAIFPVTFPATKGTVTVKGVSIPANTPLMLPVNCNFYMLVATPANVPTTPPAPTIYTVTVTGGGVNETFSVTGGTLSLASGGTHEIP